MKIINARTEIMAFPSREDLRLLEAAGRTCYKSEGLSTAGSEGPFVEKLCKVLKHESVIEHLSATVRFVVDRGVSHELVRHRLASFSQESTRYCNYSGDKFNNEITVIEPCFFLSGSPEWLNWKQACQQAGDWYFELLKCGATPQEARTVLPNSLKTEVVMTANLREWRHVFKLRCDGKAHPQMREVMVPLREYFIAQIPEIFDHE